MLKSNRPNSISKDALRDEDCPWLIYLLLAPTLFNVGLYVIIFNNHELYANNLRWMSHLSSMQYLDLNSDNLHTKVDWLQAMSKFSSFSELYLNGCQLDSLNPSFEFFNFTSLQVLDLSRNNFSHEIPKWFFNLSTNLLELNLTNSSIC